MKPIPLPSSSAVLQSILPGYYCRQFCSRVWRGDLPHWEQDGVTRFLTFRLKDSLPQEKLDELAAWRREWDVAHTSENSDAPDSSRAFMHAYARQVERWLDSGLGECLLRSPDAREVVENALLHFHGQRYVLHAFVVMPNHVHVLFTPGKNEETSAIVESWKSYSARMVNALLRRSGALWQREYWDVLMRDEEHFRRTVEYIRANAPELAYVAFV